MVGGGERAFQVNVVEPLSQFGNAPRQFIGSRCFFHVVAGNNVGFGSSHCLDFPTWALWLYPFLNSFRIAKRYLGCPTAAMTSAFRRSGKFWQNLAHFSQNGWRSRTPKGLTASSSRRIIAMDHKSRFHVGFLRQKRGGRENW